MDIDLAAADRVGSRVLRDVEMAERDRGDLHVPEVKTLDRNPPRS
jgi:hypothetical protein